MIEISRDLVGAGLTAIAGSVALYAGWQALRASTRSKRQRRAQRRLAATQRAQDAVRWASLGAGYEFTVSAEGVHDDV